MDTLSSTEFGDGDSLDLRHQSLCHRGGVGHCRATEMIQLPPDLQVLTHPAVIAVACVMYLIEFFADKVPYVDNGWDVLHTFIRVPAGAILAARTLGDVNPALELAAGSGRRNNRLRRPRHQDGYAVGPQCQSRTFQQLVRPVSPKTWRCSGAFG